MTPRKEIIGNAELWLGDCLTLPELLLTPDMDARNILAAHCRANRLRKVHNRRDAQRRRKG